MPTGKVETLRQKKAALEAKIAAIEATEKARQRKEDTRLKVLIGAAFLADSAKHPETRGAIQTVVQRAFASGGERDKDFLKSKGFLH
jgi:muramidase (phage lysozyme)